jgi:hypothetical protein
MFSLPKGCRRSPRGAGAVAMVSAGAFRGPRGEAPGSRRGYVCIDPISMLDAAPLGRMRGHLSVEAGTIWDSQPAARADVRAGPVSKCLKRLTGGSSAGRASRSQCEGRGFDPLPLHQLPLLLILRMRRWRRIRSSSMPGRSGVRSSSAPPISLFQPVRTRRPRHVRARQFREGRAFDHLPLHQFPYSSRYERDARVTFALVNSGKVGRSITFRSTNFSIPTGTNATPASHSQLVVVCCSEYPVRVRGAPVAAPGAGSVPRAFSGRWL